MQRPPSVCLIRNGVPAVVLAPMEGVADAPMRALLSELGGFSFCVAEFVRVSQSVPGAKAFRGTVPESADGWRTPSGLPVQVQLLGGDPDRVADAALVAVGIGATAVDLNFGCPAPTVNRHDGGATLLRHPDRIRAIVTAVRQAVPAHVPVSAKLRLGWDDPCSVHVNADRAAEGGADWVTIHGRTKAQGYRPPAYWRPIGAVRSRLPVPVVANGEIWTLDDLRRCRDETGCEHFMLGRGALADPWLARAAARELGVAGDGTPAGHRAAEWLPLVRRFVRLNAASGRNPVATGARVKQWLRLAGHGGRLPWFDALKTLTDLDALMARLAELAGGAAAALAG